MTECWLGFIKSMEDDLERARLKELEGVMKERKTYRAVQDETAPDAEEFFERDLEHMTGYNLAMFKNNASRTVSEDGLHTEWSLDNWVLEYDGDDPAHRLRREPFSKVDLRSLRECVMAMETGNPVYAHWMDGKKLVCAEAYVKAIHPTFFFDTNDESHAFDVGWYGTPQESFQAFCDRVESEMEREADRLL
jgi:hypothetical protein